MTKTFTIPMPPLYVEGSMAEVTQAQWNDVLDVLDGSVPYASADIHPDTNAAVAECVQAIHPDCLEPVCQFCNVPIAGRTVVVLGVPMHPDCELEFQQELDILSQHD